ncbi:MAG: ABC transporter ATP-binding protein [Phycisphaerales bacterium]
MNAAPQSLLEIRDLAVSFNRRARDAGSREPVQALAGVSLSIYPGQTLAVVGESGSGKSVTALSALGLVPCPPGRVERGSILFTGRDGRTRDLLTLSAADLRHVRGNEIAMVFQEPMTSLNPVYTVGEQIVEAVQLHQHVGAKEARARAIQAMLDVGIRDAAARFAAYPHEFSGGMRQRVMIAMALACEPLLLLADEPTTALDVTVQKQVLDLLASLGRERGMAVMLITHSLSVVAQHADVVCVMYAGRVVEYARAADLLDHPLHPYTRGLLACAPTMDGPVPDRLRTIADTVDHIVADGAVQPWWPHASPAFDTSTAPARAYALEEAAPAHYLGVWTKPPHAGGSAPPHVPRVAPPALVGA